jgi:hypothetical protein
MCVRHKHAGAVERTRRYEQRVPFSVSKHIIHNLVPDDLAGEKILHVEANVGRVQASILRGNGAIVGNPVGISPRKRKRQSRGGKTILDAVYAEDCVAMLQEVLVGAVLVHIGDCRT